MMLHVFPCSFFYQFILAFYRGWITIKIQEMLKALIRCLFTDAVPPVSHSKSSMMVSACRRFNHGVFIFLYRPDNHKQG